MIRKLCLILLIGMGGQLAGMVPERIQAGRATLRESAPVIDFELLRQIDEIFKSIFTAKYSELKSNEKLASILFGVFHMNVALKEASLKKPNNFEGSVINFDTFLTRDILQGIAPKDFVTISKALDLKDPNAYCIFFLQYIGNYYISLVEFGREDAAAATNWNLVTQKYDETLQRLAQMCFGILLQKLAQEIKGLSLLSENDLRTTMEMIAKVLGSGTLASRDLFLSGLQPIITKIDNRTGNFSENLDEFNRASKFFHDVGLLLRPERKAQNQAYWNKFSDYYLILGRELLKRTQPMPIAHQHQPMPAESQEKESVVIAGAEAKAPVPAPAVYIPAASGSAATPPPSATPPSKIAQLRAWVNSNRLKAAGVTATIAAAGYAVYRWFTGKPATK